MHYIGVRDGKKGKMEKRRQNKFQHHGFLVYNILQPSVGVYRLLALIGAEKSVAINVQIKGMISMRMLILSSQYKSYSMFSLNFKILDRVVPEKYLMEEKVYTQTLNRQTFL